MREFKFRAWDKNNKTFVPDDIFGIRIGPIGTIDSEHLIFNQNSLYEKAHEIEVMQFTGYKDYYGKEIYESDILESIGFSYNQLTNKHDIPTSFFYEGVVTYGQISKSTGITGHGEGNGIFSCIGFYCKSGRFINDIYNNGMRIIGNIYQNPELLKG